MGFTRVCTATLPHPNLYLFNRHWCVWLCYMYSHTQIELAALHVLNVCAWGTSATFTEWKQTGSFTWIHRAMVAFVAINFQNCFKSCEHRSFTLKHCQKGEYFRNGAFQNYSHHLKVVLFGSRQTCWCLTWQAQHIVVNVEPCHEVQRVCKDRGHSGFSEALKQNLNKTTGLWMF